MGVGGGRGGGAGGEEAKKHVVDDDDARFFEGVFSKRGSFFHVKFRVFLFFFTGFGFFEKEKKKSAILKKRARITTKKERAKQQRANPTRRSNALPSRASSRRKERRGRFAKKRTLFFFFETRAPLYRSSSRCIRGVKVVIFVSSSLLAYFLKGGGGKRKMSSTRGRRRSRVERTRVWAFCLVLSLAFASRGVSGASDGRVESDREETGDVKKLYRGEEGKEAKAPKAEVNFFDAPFADVNAKDVASTVNVAEFSGGFAPRRALQVRLIRFLSRLFLVLTTTRVFFSWNFRSVLRSPPRRLVDSLSQREIDGDACTTLTRVFFTSF